MNRCSATIQCDRVDAHDGNHESSLHDCAWSDDGPMTREPPLLAEPAGLIDENKVAEYRICKRRGHQPGNMVRGDGWHVCKWCGTAYTHETRVIEDVPPKESA